jgi:hypothetical protein
MVALMAMNAAVSAMRAFSGGGDGGLGAALRATQEGLNLLNHQLGHVQTELGNLAEAVGRLPATFDMLQEMHYVRERIWKIQAQAGIWGEVIGSNRDIKPESLSPSQKENLRQVLLNARNSRAELSYNTPGETALAATVASVALALETNTEALLGGTLETQIRVLDSYKKWLARIQDKNIPSSAATELARLEAEINEKRQKLNEILGMSIAELPSNWEGYFPITRMEGSCLQVSWVEIEARALDIFGRKSSVTTRFGARAGVYVYFTITSERQKGVRQWALHTYIDKTTQHPVHRPAWVSNARSIDTVPCVPIGLPRESTAEGIEAHIQGGDWFRKQDNILERGKNIVDELNLIEAQAAFHRQGIAMSIEASNQIDRWLAVLQ